VDAATIQRAAAGLPNNIYNTLAQVAGATPRVATPRIARLTPGATPQQFPVAGFSGGFNVVSFCNFQHSIDKLTRTVCFVDIYGNDDHHFLNFLFIKLWQFNILVLYKLQIIAGLISWIPL
jgi:hypothetical protein